MAKNYIQDGDVMPYTNSGAAIASGAVVAVGNMIGIALGDIAATTGTGQLAVADVWEVPKVTASAIAKGEKLLWDSSEGKFDNSAATAASGDILGAAVAWEAAAANTTTTVKVKLTPGNTVVTP